MSSRPSLTVTRVTPDANADSASASRPPESSPASRPPESSPASRPPESSPGITGSESSPGITGSESSPGITGSESSPGITGSESSPGITDTERILNVRSLDGPGARQDQRSVGRQANASREPPARPPALGEKPRLRSRPVLTRFRRADPVQRADTRVQAQRRGVRQACLAPGQRHRGGQAAEFVDEAVVRGVRPGPHPAPGDLVHLLGGHATAGGNLAGEVRVDPVQPGIDPAPLLVAERPGGAERAGGPASAPRVGAHPAPP